MEIKQLTIDELREQFHNWYIEKYHTTMIALERYSRTKDYISDKINYHWISYLECARANYLIKETL